MFILQLNYLLSYRLVNILLSEFSFASPFLTISNRNAKGVFFFEIINF